MSIANFVPNVTSTLAIPQLPPAGGHRCSEVKVPFRVESPLGVLMYVTAKKPLARGQDGNGLLRSLLLPALRSGTRIRHAKNPAKVPI